MFLFNFRWKVRLVLGRVYNSWKKAGADYEQFVEFSQNKQNGPLSKERIDQITKWQVNAVNDSNAQLRSEALITDEILDQPREGLTMQNKGTRLLYDALNKFQDNIKTVANIGSRVDTTLTYLAPKFPDIHFTSVDFQPNLKELNRYLPQFENRSYLSGYALNLMREEKLKSDLVFMTSTSVLFNNKELNAFFDEFSRSVKFVVLNEPWWPKVKSLNFLKIVKPENIPPETPYCAGVYSNYHHNYIHKLESRGYEIISSEIVLSKGIYSALQIVAKKRTN